MRKWNESSLEQVVAQSLSIAQVLTSLGLKPAGGNYRTIKDKIDTLGLDTAHFKGQRWSKGKNFPSKKPLEELLVINSIARTKTIKRRLLAEGVKLHECESCRLSEWMNEPIPLELHHMNGNNKDQRFENLQLLCPNCHAQTDTYRGKNIGRI